ncbi:MAG: hypothetical protein RIC19_18330 [Phaeodactylibacter sp.]|uniref:hypothetical protein n=1 Tax=Phaeodactylibacter sp. TaxID=1940289 RepID=UPI0032ED294E
MNYHRKSIRSARAIRTKALFLTLLFHIGVIAYFTYGADLALLELLPDTVLDFLGMNAAEAPDVPIP